MACPRLLRQAIFTVHAGTVLIAILLGVLLWLLYDARNAARQQAEQQTSNIALALERDVSRSVGALDLSLRAAIRGMETPGLATMDPQLRESLLFDGAIAAEGFGGVFVTDEAGSVIYDSLGLDPRRINVMDRGYFQALRAHADLGLLLSEPLRSRSDGEWSLALARRINHPDGSFAGVAIGSLKLTYFQQLFSALDIGERGTVSIIREDGLLIDRRPHFDADVGHDIGRPDLLRRLAVGEVGVVEVDAVKDGVRRLYSYRQVGSLPLVISVGFSVQEIYAHWSQKAIYVGGILLLLFVTSLCLLWEHRAESLRRTLAENSAERSSHQYKEALARLDALFSNSDDAMLVACVGADGGFVYEAVNPVWESIAGVAAAAAVGRSPEACLPPEVAETVVAAWRDCIAERRPIHFRFTSQQPGDARAWEASVAPVVSADGGVHRLIAVARDMTQRNHMEESLRQSQRMEAVGQLTAGVAHDFNNLLQAILGTFDLLREQAGLDAEGRACLTVAEGAGQRCATLVHRLLAFSRKQILEPALLEPERVLAELTPLLTHAVGNRIRIEIDADAATSPVRADGAQLENCLFNLALNARDAMPAGGTLRLRADTQGAAAAADAGLAPGRYTRFTVQDFGAGMSPETLARAVEPFFTTKELGKGTGLGLSMVQGFARQSGGDVRIESALGHGTSVSLWLPCAADEAVPEIEAPVIPPPVAAHGDWRVLVVDDEAVVLKTLTLFLTKAGFDAMPLPSGDAALRFLAAGEACDLLITDQSMPGLTGSELIGEALRLRPQLPTMLITGFDKVAGLDELPDSVTVLRKPFQRDTFVRHIQKLLDTAAASHAHTPGYQDAN